MRDHVVVLFASALLACSEGPGAGPAGDSDGGAETGSSAGPAGDMGDDGGTGSSTDGGGGDSSDEGSADGSSESDTTGNAPDGCEAPVPLLSVREVADTGDHPCATWLDAVRGRVAHNGGASMVVWSVKTDAGVGLFVSANHVLGEGWYASGGDDVARMLAAPDPNAGIARLSLPPVDGSFTSPWGMSPMFELFNAEIPGSETGDGLTNILPRHDYHVALVDAQRLEESGGLAPLPGPLQLEPLPLHDPTGAASAASTWADPAPGDDVLTMGYPANELAEFGAFSVGKVLSTAEAEAAIAELAAAGDEEGSIPHDPEVELLVQGDALVGMSGGGVFDRDGRLVGVAVRASASDPQYIRVVRMQWIHADLAEAFDELPPDERAAVEPFLSGELER